MKYGLLYCSKIDNITETMSCKYVFPVFSPENHNIGTFLLLDDWVFSCYKQL